LIREKTMGWKRESGIGNRELAVPNSGVSPGVSFIVGEPDNYTPPECKRHCPEGEIGNGGLENPKSKIQNLKSKIEFSCLLPTGEVVLDSWQIPWERGYRTFKWKIGVAAIADELAVFEQLMAVLPKTARLRLDANGGLTRQDAGQWLQVAQGRVEFLEQPLPPEELDAMLEMSAQYSTPIALDESVATLDRFEICYERGWRGIFVIKAAIAGSPQRLRQFCREHQPDVVFSSVFETEIGRQAALQLAAELSSPDRAVGFGVDRWFTEELGDLRF
jgi:O-succinylbenzoate synthase